MELIYLHAPAKRTDISKLILKTVSSLETRRKIMIIIIHTLEIDKQKLSYYDIGNCMNYFNENFEAFT